MKKTKMINRAVSYLMNDLAYHADNEGQIQSDADYTKLIMDNLGDKQDDKNVDHIVHLYLDNHYSAEIPKFVRKAFPDVVA